ncbi:MAG: hypothetical protein ACREA2_19930 [Blastocatellia bacterium]
MVSQPLEIEGTWEEIVALSPNLTGRRVRLIILPTIPVIEDESAPKDTHSLEEKIAAIWADVPEEEWAKLPPDLSDQQEGFRVLIRK